VKSGNKYLWLLLIFAWEISVELRLAELGSSQGLNFSASDLGSARLQRSPTIQSGAP
jgi:hypothetical protein